MFKRSAVLTRVPTLNAFAANAVLLVRVGATLPAVLLGAAAAMAVVDVSLLDGWKAVASTRGMLGGYL